MFEEKLKLLWNMKTLKKWRAGLKLLDLINANYQANILMKV